MGFELFNKNDESLKKVGVLKDHQATQEVLSPLLEQSKGLEEKIAVLDRELQTLRDERRKIDRSIETSQGYASGSELYETGEGALVASLPDDHPVIKKIELLERIEMLSGPAISAAIKALTQEFEGRLPIRWSGPRLAESGSVTEEDGGSTAMINIPDHLQDVILHNKGNGHASWEGRSPDLESEAEYIRTILPDLFGNKNVPIKLISFCSEYNGAPEKKYGSRNTGFSGAAIFTDERIFGEKYAQKRKNFQGAEEVYYPPCLVLVTKDGARYCLLETEEYKTYPQITKYGPDFSGYGKTSEGRFRLRNVVFKGAYSSADHELSSEENKVTVETLQQALSDGAVVEGLDPEIYFDEQTRSIVLNKPMFLRG